MFRSRKKKEAAAQQLAQQQAQQQVQQVQQQQVQQVQPQQQQYAAPQAMQPSPHRPGVSAPPASRPAQVRGRGCRALACWPSHWMIRPSLFVGNTLSLCVMRIRELYGAAVSFGRFLCRRLCYRGTQHTPFWTILPTQRTRTRIKEWARGRSRRQGSISRRLHKTSRVQGDCPCDVPTSRCRPSFLT